MTTSAGTELAEGEVVPSLVQLAEAIPGPSVRLLIDQHLGRGHTPDATTGAVSSWLLATLDWRSAGCPGGRLGPAGEAMLRAAIRVVVDAVDRARRPPARARTGTPRPTVPRPAPVARASVAVSEPAGPPELPDGSFELLGEPGPEDR